MAFLGMLPACLSHPLVGVLVVAALAAADLLAAVVVVGRLLVASCSVGPGVAPSVFAVVAASGPVMLLLLLPGLSSECLPCWLAF